MSNGCDLHTHTTCSDGTSSPVEVVAKAIEANLAAVAVTDHDTVDGIAEALAAQSNGVRVVAGVELSAERDGAETHVVGLFIDPTNAALGQVLEQKRLERQRRVAEMAERLASLGKPVDLDAVLAEAPPESVSRTHLAEAMRRAGHVGDVNEAFNRWLGEEQPAYVPRPRFSIPDACALIRAAGGLPALAHPYVITKKELKACARQGIAAVEAYGARFGPGWSRRLRRWARELDLGICGGSDHHGRHRPGAAIGSVRVPVEYLEELKRRLD